MSDSALIGLTYLSKITVAKDRRGQTKPLLPERILESAREFNLTLGVTGVLLVGKRCFAQILEGTASAVDEIFERRILPATSHTDVLLLSRKHRIERSFHDWKVAFVRDQTASLDRFVEHRAWEIDRARSLSESPSHWPLDLLLEDVSRIVDNIATASAEKRGTERARFGSVPPDAHQSLRLGPHVIAKSGGGLELLASLSGGQRGVARRNVLPRAVR